MVSAKLGIDDTIKKMAVLISSIPDAFQTAKENYLKQIDKLNGVIQNKFQETLDHGFQQVYLTVTIASIFGLILLVFYRRKDEDDLIEYHA